MKTVDELMSLPYHVLLVRDENAGGVACAARVEELPGCISEGDTPEEAAAMIGDAMRAWFQAQLAAGGPIPPPRPEPSRSGRIMLRVPAMLHGALADEAARQGVSLNQLLTSLLAGAIGWDDVMRRPKEGRRARSA